MNTKIENLRIVNINTTAFDEEDFLLLTNLSDEQIIQVIKPVVDEERNGDSFYTNEDLYWSIVDKYPNDVVIMYTADSIDSLSI